MYKLYTFQECPYCTKVREAFDQMDIEYEEINADYGTEGAKLVQELGGRLQVPFLLDEANDVKMYESNDIIAYAQEHSG